MDVSDVDFNLSELEKEIDDDEDFVVSKKKNKTKIGYKKVTEVKKKTIKGKSKKMVKSTKKKEEVKEKKDKLDPKLITKLSYMFMDTYSPIDEKSAINNLNDGSFIPLEYNIQDQGPILGLQLSKDSKLLATMSSLGHIKLWEIGSFKLLATLRDNEETEIDEFYKGQFSPTQQYFVTGGKRKDRTIWSEQDNDNKIIDCYIKVFDLLTGKVINLLKAHTEEILSIKQVYFKSQNYYLSTSQDGYIYKWLLSKDHKEIISSTRIQDNDTCMAFNVSFLPNTGNKYFLGACDNMIKLFDFEHAKPVQKFESPYSSYCDNIKFLNLFPDVKEQLDNLYEDQIEDNDNERNHAYFISRGVELLDDDGNMLTDTENTVNLHILCYPKFSGDTFKIKNLKCFKDERYASNSWYINITSNGRYIMAPTVNGEVFIFCLITGNVKGVLKDHGDIEIRDLIFHPNEKYFFTCSEDGKVIVYGQDDENGFIDLN